MSDQLTNRTVIRRRIFTATLGVVTSVIGIGFPFLLYLIWGSDSLGIGIVFIWSYLVAPALIFGGLLVYDGFSKPQVRRWTYRVSRDIAIVVSLLLCLVYSWMLGSMAHASYIAPRAEVIFPDNFEGYFTVILDDFAQPSMRTASKTYIYEIPDDGVSRYSTGWICAGSWFADGKSIPKDHSTFWRWRNGAALASGTFEIAWLGQGPKIRGIAGRVAALDSMVVWRNGVTYGEELQQYADSVYASLQP